MRGAEGPEFQCEIGLGVEYHVHLYAQFIERAHRLIDVLVVASIGDNGRYVAARCARQFLEFDDFVGGAWSHHVHVEQDQGFAVGHLSQTHILGLGRERWFELSDLGLAAHIHGFSHFPELGCAAHLCGRRCG